MSAACRVERRGGRRTVTARAVYAVIGLFGLLIAGCAGNPQVRALPDGDLQVDCPGGYHDWSACRSAARRYCARQSDASGQPLSFRVVGQISDEGGSVGTRDWSQAGSVVTRTMAFRCAPAGADPAR
jgi:hypothetical protein